MKARPILFSGAMVRALLAGSKTQTRRIVKPQPPSECGIHYVLGNESWLTADQRTQLRHLWEAWGGPLHDARPEGHLCGHHEVVCPYGVAGDLLWVREAIGRRPASFLGFEATNGVESAFYKADEEDVVNEHDFNLCPWWKGKGLPSIHMPRAVSRLTLEIADVRVERLQDVSETDAIAEGLDLGTGEADGMWGVGDVTGRWFRPERAYQDLWEQINGPGSWTANPWVWVVAFKVHHQNVDAFLDGRAA